MFGAELILCGCVITTGCTKARSGSSCCRTRANFCTEASSSIVSGRKFHRKVNWHWAEARAMAPKECTKEQGAKVIGRGPVKSIAAKSKAAGSLGTMWELRPPCRCSKASNLLSYSPR